MFNVKPFKFNNIKKYMKTMDFSNINRILPPNLKKKSFCVLLTLDIIAEFGSLNKPKMLITKYKLDINESYMRSN